MVFFFPALFLLVVLDTLLSFVNNRPKKLPLGVMKISFDQIIKGYVSNTLCFIDTATATGR